MLLIFTSITLLGIELLQSREYEYEFVNGHYEVHTLRDEHTGEEIWVDSHEKKS